MAKGQEGTIRRIPYQRPSTVERCNIVPWSTAVQMNTGRSLRDKFHYRLRSKIIQADTALLLPGGFFLEPY
eukprot:scaffold201_cov405-Prasinococcus_capsulatus_cf.AAC.27